MSSERQSARKLKTDLKHKSINQYTDDIIVALAGNPNVGKSTVFNNLTGLKQHTGNWPGKTVANAQGRFKHRGRDFILADLPGTYSLMSNSVEEEIARNFICFGNPDVTVVVADATCLERNLNLVLQVMEISGNTILCVNLLDEAARKGIRIDLKALAQYLYLPVIGTSARNGKGLKELMDAVYNSTKGKPAQKPFELRYNNVIETAIEIVRPAVAQLLQNRPDSRWIAMRLLDNDRALQKALNRYLGMDLMADKKIAIKVAEAIKYLSDNGIGPQQFRDTIVSEVIGKAEEVCRAVVKYGDEGYDVSDRKIDGILTSRVYGIPLMIGFLCIIFWLTITGANYPSLLIASLLSRVESYLTSVFIRWGAPEWIYGLLVLGMYRTLSWVISVMLPPMAIFFPLFTFLEDLGYLPRVAFNLDNFFKKACAHGKQALTMCMGFGCNAVGVIGCRIIDSPRERLIAVITNNFVPCNGRFPTLIAIITMFFAGSGNGLIKSLISAFMLSGVIVVGVTMTLLISKLLSKTILKGLPSSFALELPPYRRPQFGRIIVRSIFDRTLFVLGRAVVVAAPAGLLIWAMANVSLKDVSLLSHCADFFDPFARLIGLDGFILMAFILGFPANEIVMPIIIMSYMSAGNMAELSNLGELKGLLVSNGWTWITAICTMLFSLMHFPCGTTCMTIKKETQSLKWTAVSILIPTLTGIIMCFIVANIAALFGFA